jgi:hypothetical protein
MNSNEMLSQLSETNKKELREVIYDRLIADNTLIKDHPEYINNLVDINLLIDETNAKLLINNYEICKKNIIWIVYYDLMTPGSNKINELFLLDNSLKIYVNNLKKIMVNFLK